MKMDKSLLKKLVALAGALVFAALAGVDFYDHRHSKETVVASDALTETHMLSEWLPNLEAVSYTHLRRQGEHGRQRQ